MCTTIRTEDRDAVQNMVPIEDIYRQIDEAKDLDCISITGGEPTIRKDLTQIIQKVRKKAPNQKVRLLTNGRMLSYKPFCIRLKKESVDTVVVPLHAHVGSLHDFIARAKGGYDQTMKGIANAVDANLEVEIRIVIHGINYPFLPEIAEMIRNRFPTVSVVFLYFDIIGSAYLNRKKLVVPMTRVVPYLEKAVTLLNPEMVRVFHFPLCTLPKSLRDQAKGTTVPERRIGWAGACESCKAKDECPGIWKTYLKIVGEEEFKAL